eukprot:jgi/Mesen1/1316/ME000013S00807
MAAAVLHSGTACKFGTLVPLQSAHSPRRASSALCTSSSRSTFQSGQSNLLQAAHIPCKQTVQKRSTVICAASDLKQQFKEMAALEKRWESQVTEGKVKSLSAKEAGYAYQLADYVLLDVRPSSEHNKAWVKESIWIPAFDEDHSLAPGIITNKLTNFLFGGWWSGAGLTKRNERFMPDVVAKIPKSANVIVACQKGLRSLAACEQLYKAGYRNLFWVNGGFETAEDGDFERDGPQALKFAGLGGMSEFLGWTDIQRAESSKEGLGFRLVVVLAVDVAFVGFQALTAFLQAKANS